MEDTITESKTTPAAGGASTEERLHQVAMELFAEGGYGGTSMSDIARGVGVQKASLYNYYSSKDELLLDLVHRAVEAWTGHSRPPLLGSGTRQERLRAHLEAAMDFVTERPHEAAIVRLAATQITGELGQRVQEMLGEKECEHCALLETFFAEAMEEGEIEEADPRDLVVYWNVFADGLMINELLCPAGSNRYRGRLGQLWSRFWLGMSGCEASGGEERNPGPGRRAGQRGGSPAKAQKGGKV